MSTVIRATGPADFLSLVPALAGFTPKQSLVLVPFHGRYGKGAIRFDLPASDVELSVYAAQAIGLLCRLPGVDAVAIFVYDSKAIAEGAPAHAPLVSEFQQRLDICGFRLIESLCIAATHWSDYRDESNQWHPLSTVPDAPKIPGLGELDRDQEAGAALPKIAPKERAAVSQALDAVTAAFERWDAETSDFANQADRQLGAADTILADLPGFFETMIKARGRIDPTLIAALAWSLNHPALCEIALLHWARGQRHAAAAVDARLAEQPTGADHPNADRDTLLGRGSRPDAQRLQRALALVRRVSASVPKSQRAGSLIAAAWLAWALGRSTHAGIYLEQALALPSSHTVAESLKAAVDTGGLPDWAFEASW